MAVRIYVTYALPATASYTDVLEVREKLARDTDLAYVGSVKAMRAHEVGGGTEFAEEGMIGDAQFQAASMDDAMIAVGLLAMSLLRQGFTVSPVNGKLIARMFEHAMPTPRVAYVAVVASPGGS